jgi:hypothetical protein
MLPLRVAVRRRAPRPRSADPPARPPAGRRPAAATGRPATGDRHRPGRGRGSCRRRAHCGAPSAAGPPSPDDRTEAGQTVIGTARGRRKVARSDPRVAARPPGRTAAVDRLPRARVAVRHAIAGARIAAPPVGIRLADRRVRRIEVDLRLHPGGDDRSRRAVRSTRAGPDGPTVARASHRPGPCCRVGRAAVARSRGERRGTGATGRSGPRTPRATRRGRRDGRPVVRHGAVRTVGLRGHGPHCLGHRRSHHGR